MTQLWAWEYKGKAEWGLDLESSLWTLCHPVGENESRNKFQVTNLRKVKVVDEDADPTPPITKKTYLTTDQFIKVWKSLDDAKIKQLSEAWVAIKSAAWFETWSAAWFETRSAAWSAAWLETQSAAWFEAGYADLFEARYAAWYLARSADLAVLAKDKLTAKQFEILTSPWTSCGLSLFVEDWEQVLTPPITEPKNFGAIVKWGTNEAFLNRVGEWIHTETFHRYSWGKILRECHNLTIISEGVEE